VAKSKHPAPPDAADPTDGVERPLPGAGERLEAGHLAPRLGDGTTDPQTADQMRQRNRELARAMSRDLVKEGDREGELVEGSPPELLLALDRALAQPPQDVPRMELARSLEEAGPRTFVYIDNQGRVRSPVQYRLMQVFSYSMLAAILIGGTALYASLLGPQGLLFGVMFSALVGRNLRLTRQINQAALLSSHDRLDEAEVLLRRLLSRRLVGRRLRALIHHNLGAVATRRGDHEEALGQLRSAIGLYQAAWRRSPHLRSCQYGEVIALCNLRRADEARQRLLSLPEQSEGDYLLVKYWTTELYVRFCRGDAPPDDGTLWERAERALRITSSAALLALCAWGFTRSPGKQSESNLDMAWHLLREAFDRLDGEPLRTIMPPLWQWMTENRGTAEAAA
jgi:tetratricopeptide (TPR) repeat protein